MTDSQQKERKAQLKKHARWVVPLILLLLIIWGISEINLQKQPPYSSAELKEKVDGLRVGPNNLQFIFDHDQLTLLGEVSSQLDKDKIISTFSLLPRIGDINAEKLTISLVSPPKISYQFNDDELTITISDGTAPFDFKVSKDGQEIDRLTFSESGDQTISLAEYRENPGIYRLEVIDEVNKSASEEIVIDPPKVPLKKLIDGYKTVRLSGLIWMAENLNLKVDGSWCYDLNPANCTKYGHLYTWAAAKAACASLDARLPTDEEWQTMIKEFGGAGKVNATDDGAAAYRALMQGGRSGFSALIGGQRNPDRSFHNLKDYNGYYWAATEENIGSAWSYRFSLTHHKLFRYSNDKRFGFSCRCVQDARTNIND